MNSFESLESRQLLNGVVQAKLSSTGLLTITGSSLGDTIIVKQVGNQVAVEVGENNELTSLSSQIVDGKIDIGLVKKIVVNAGGGRDYVSVDSIRARKLSTVQINGDGANDTLVSRMERVTLRGGAGNDFLKAEGDGASIVMTSQDASGNVSNIYANGFVTMMGRVSGYNVLEGGSGDDRLATRGGDDSVYGGDGQDTLEKLNNIEVSFTNLPPQPTPNSDIVTTRLVRVAAFGIDKIIDTPDITYDVSKHLQWSLQPAKLAFPAT